MPRVLLVSANRERFPEPVFPLGAAYVASALRRDGNTVRIFDAGLYRDPAGALRKEIAGFRPEAVGLSLRNLDNAAYPATRCYLPGYVELTRAVRESSGAPVLLGGPAFSIFPDELQGILAADGGVTGDGEDGAGRILRRGNGRVHGALEDLGSVEFPRDIGGIFPRFRDYGTIGVQSARGCPHGCVYCTYPHLEGRAVRPRPPGIVAGEMAFLCRAHDRRDFFVVDSSFNADEDHMAAVCEAVAALRLPIRFSCYLEPRVSDARLFRLLARAGCVAVDFGTDSGSDTILRALRKGFTVDDVRAASAACRAAGIDACHSLILGGPGETPGTLGETVGLMDELRPRAVVAMTGIRVYPGTEMERIARTEGIVGSGDDLLPPRFYVAGGDGEWLLRRAREIASSRRNWFLPGARDWSAAVGPRLLRLVHRGGPLWRAFRSP